MLLTPTYIVGLSRNQIPDFSADTELNAIYRSILGDQETLLKIILENQILVCKSNNGSCTKGRKCDHLEVGDLCCFFHSPSPNEHWKLGMVHQIFKALGSDRISKARILYVLNNV